MPIQIIKPETLSDSVPNYSIAVQGVEKSGKTHFICSMPEEVNIAYTDPNRATAEGFMREGRKINLYLVQTWKDFQEWVRLADARELPGRTLAVDSFGFLSDRLVAETAGPDGAVTIPQWGRIKDQNWTELMKLLGCTQPKGSHPGYHVVVSTHLTDVTDDKGNLVKVRPAISGSFKDTFGRCFDSVFISRSKAERAVEAGKLVVKPTQYMLLTAPPDQYHTCGDGIGGKGGRKRLPSEVENTFPALCRAWGVDPK